MTDLKVDDWTGMKRWEATFTMKLTKFGRKFFKKMLSDAPPYKRNKNYGYGR